MQILSCGVANIEQSKLDRLPSLFIISKKCKTEIPLEGWTGQINQSKDSPSASSRFSASRAVEIAVMNL